MGRVYTVTAEGIVLADTDKGDLLVLVGAANRPFQVLSCRVTQREQETATQARVRLVRRSTADTTAGSGTVGVSKHQASDAAAGFSGTMKRVATTPTLGTEAGVIHVTNDSLPNGMQYLPTPEERQLFAGTADYFCVNFPDGHGVPSQNVTFDVIAVVEEFG